MEDLNSGKFVDELHEDSNASEDVPEAVEAVAEIVEERGGVDHFIERLSGRNSKLRPSKPKAGADDRLEQYIWRMARFHSGEDTSMPVTASMDLQIFLDEQGIEASVSGITDDDGEAINDYLEELTDRVLVGLGLSPFKAARAWKGTGVFG